jgi:hypothetical protein
MIKNIKVKASKMDLISKYSEACEKFFSYLIENNIVQVDLDVLNILLQNNLRVSLGKCKIDNMTTCKALIKSGARKGEECGKVIKCGERACKLHSKAKEPIEESEPLQEDEIYIIRKNAFNNFVYGNTGLIFKSSTEKHIVAKEGSKGEWLPLEEDDINLCKKNGLRWKKIENKVIGETFNLEVLRKYDVFPKLEERSVQRFLNIEDDENSEN